QVLAGEEPERRGDLEGGAEAGHDFLARVPGRHAQGEHRAECVAVGADVTGESQLARLANGVSSGLTHVRHLASLWIPPPALLGEYPEGGRGRERSEPANHRGFPAVLRTAPPRP